MEDEKKDIETIKSKIQKLLELSERGEEHEAEVAKAKLEELLKKNNLTLEDISSVERKERVFRYKAEEELKLLIHIIISYVGSKSEMYKAATYNQQAKMLFINLSDIEYVDIKNLFNFHVSEYKKEKKAILESLPYAYLRRQQIFDASPSDNPSPELTEEQLKILKKVISLAGQMDVNSYLKQLTEGEEED